MIDFEEIRKEIAIEHNTLLRKDDPVLMTVTINQLMFEKYVQILIEKNAEQNKKYLEELKTAQKQGIADAKVTAGRVITEGGVYLEDRARDGLMSAMKDVVAQHKKDLSAAWQEIVKARKAAYYSAAVAIGAAVGAVVANVF